MQADTELMLRRSLPGCSPRALAAARILSAADAAELAGRSTEALGRWQEPVSPINEVHIPFYHCRMFCTFNAIVGGYA